MSAEGWTCIICLVTSIITSVLANPSFAFIISKILRGFGKACTIHTYINAYTHAYYNSSRKITSAEELPYVSSCHCVKQGIFSGMSHIAVAHNKQSEEVTYLC